MKDKNTSSQFGELFILYSPLYLKQLIVSAPLTLDRSKIENALKDYNPDATVKGPEVKPNGLNIYVVSVSGQNDATLNVYFRKDGDTSIVSAVGKNQPLSSLLAEHIVNTCHVKNIPSKTLYIKKISDDEFNDFIEYLKECNLNIEDGSNIANGMQLKATSEYGDYIVINKYDKGSLQVQGGNKRAKSIAIDALTQLLPFGDIIQAQLVSLESNVKSDEVISIVEHMLPISYGYLGATLIAIISPSIALKSSEIELTDYSAFVFPSLRGMEGYIKKLFFDNGIVISNDGFGSYVGMDNILGRIVATAKTRAIITNPKVITAIENTYTYYKSIRHVTFHVDGTIESTKVIEDKQEADIIIEKVFNTIEQTYSNIVS